MNLRENLSCSQVVLGVLVAAGLAATPATASIIQSVSGTSSAGVAFVFDARLTISGNTLTVVLENNSTVRTQNPADLLTSFYFDIKNSLNVRPTLTYASATGGVWLTSRNNTDVLQSGTANLMAVNPNDNTWQFKTFNAGSNPFLGFGIGTAGNSALRSNGFNGNITGGFDYSIYAGDITTQNLSNTLLVKNSATFVFTGVSGFSEADIVPRSVFGLGTAPDSVVAFVPAPGAAACLGIGGLLAMRRRR